MTRCGCSVLLLQAAVWLLCCPVMELGGQGKSVRDGVYTREQADRGAKLHGQFCSGCHGPERFVGEQMKPWAGGTADVLFNAIRLTMPEERPNSLTRQQYADLLAYIFRLNEFKAGNDELKGDETLMDIQIEEFAAALPAR